MSVNTLSRDTLVLECSSPLGRCPLVGNGRNTVWKVLFRKRELTEFWGELGEFCENSVSSLFHTNIGSEKKKKTHKERTRKQNFHGIVPGFLGGLCLCVKHFSPP